MFHHLMQMFIEMAVIQESLQRGLSYQRQTRVLIMDTGALEEKRERKRDSELSHDFFKKTHCLPTLPRCELASPLPVLCSRPRAFITSQHSTSLLPNDPLKAEASLHLLRGHLI